MTHHTHCALRLGDNLAALQLVRKLAQAYPEREFVHACNFEYGKMRAQLAEMVEDLPNIRLVSLDDKHPDSVDLWKGANNYFYSHPKWREYVPFMLDFYALCCVRIGLPCPITKREDMLFDYPALKKRLTNPKDCEWLVINSRPLSGQFLRYSESEADNLINALAEKYSVITTAPSSAASVVCLAYCGIHQIGRLSQGAENILMVSTGPSWPTFNIWNDATVKRRIILLDNEQVELAPNTVHCSSWAEAHRHLIAEGVL